MNDIREKIENLTQRLDHMVPDPELSWEANHQAAVELKLLTDTLFEMLPDCSLSPLERLERLARVNQKRTPDKEQLKPAHVKLKELKIRLNEIAAPSRGCAHEKLLKLALEIDEAVGPKHADLPVIKKLELLGDPSGRIEPE